MSKPDRPHIILLLSDEHRGQAMAHLGDPNVSTPNMDALADEGVSFATAFANCPLCTPSRGSLFSGRHAHASPVASFHDNWKIGAPSLAHWLGDAGYHSAYFGKWHCGITRNQHPGEKYERKGKQGESPLRTPECYRAGFADWFGFEGNNNPFESYYYHQDELEPRWMEGYQTDALTDLTISYLRDYDHKKPLFLVLSVEPPHFPLEAPEEYLARYQPEKLQVRPNFSEDPPFRHQLARYYAMIENLDDNLGRLRQSLHDLPSFHGQTMLMYLSDHGDFMGSHGVSNRKEHPHEESIRIPAIFSGRGIVPANAPREGLFSMIDVAPTLLGIADVPKPASVQGTDWSPALRGDRTFSGPDNLLLEICGSPRWAIDDNDWRAVRTKRFKYAHYENGGELLFDLQDDPYEQTNLAENQSHSQLSELRQLLRQKLRETCDPYWEVLMDEGQPNTRTIHDIGTWKRPRIITPDLGRWIQTHP